MTIEMSGHPPFGAQVILNGHKYVACAAGSAGTGFTKEGTCFTAVADRQALARVADTLSQHAAIGHLRQVCDRWIYSACRICSACLCVGLDLDEQQRSAFRWTLFGTKQRPRNKERDDLSPRVGGANETHRHELTLFKVHFGLLTLKAYTKGEHVLAIRGDRAQHPSPLVGRTLERFP